MPASARFGCIVLLVFGLGHVILTVADVWVPALTRPLEPGVVEVLASTPTAFSVLIGAPDLTVWSGHLGWNVSVGLGIAYAGAMGLIAGPVRPVLTAVTVTAVGFLALALAFWFWGPVVGMGAAVVSLAAARARVPTSEPQRPIPKPLWACVLMVGAGAGHLLATFSELPGPGLFMPEDESVRTLMRQATELALPSRLGSQRSFADAYVGFNFGHGWAVVSAGALTFLAVRWTDPRSCRRALALALALALAYALVSSLCWFWLPTVACLIAAAALLSTLRTNADARGISRR